MPKERLDFLLVHSGLCPSREQAKRLILAGEVLVADRVVDKPGMLVAKDAPVRVRTQQKFVSRGGLKLEGALDHFQIDVAGAVALDIGASTGGFTDCLLQRGAARVYAFDVGTNQLVWKLRSDPRVISKENYNMRYLKTEDIGEPLDVLVADVSFISLTLVLGPAIDCLKLGGQGVVLVKPQFELAREQVGKGGIVREPELHALACQRIQDFILQRADCTWKGIERSCIQGTEGNVEFLAWFIKQS